MRYLIISDIHGNLPALQEVLNHAPSYDGVLCLGDLVGYGASPNDVIETVAKLNLSGQVRGNHDKVCSGLDPGYNFNNNAFASAMWTLKNLTPKNLEYLRSMRQGPLRIDDLITISHGSPMDEDYYILYENDAYASFDVFDTPICFFGHTHVPGIFILEESPPAFYYVIPEGDFQVKIDLDGSKRYLINPGSIGQPRDYDPRASFCLFDTETKILSFNKLTYPVQEAARQIQQASLPEFLANRLLTGV